MRISQFYYTYEDALILLSNGTTVEAKATILKRKKSAVQRARERMKTELLTVEQIKNIKRLVLSGYTVDQVVEKTQIKRALVNAWFDRTIRMKYYGTDSVNLGWKNESYYPAELYEEEDCWEIPTYNVEDLSEDELAIYNADLDELHKPEDE